jgi:hypothetical protein
MKTSAHSISVSALPFDYQVGTHPPGHPTCLSWICLARQRLKFVGHLGKMSLPDK